MFIVIEGGEGVGKTTQSVALALALVKLDKKVIITHEPGGTPFGEQIRNILKSSPDLTLEQQFHLFHAARIDHIIRCK